jgi:hypothetical protein
MNPAPPPAPGSDNGLDAAGSVAVALSLVSLTQLEQLDFKCVPSHPPAPSRAPASRDPDEAVRRSYSLFPRMGGTGRGGVEGGMGCEGGVPKVSGCS